MDHLDVVEGDAQLVSMICDHEVACPWPCGEVPVITVTLPVGCTRTVEVSQPPA